MLAFLNLAPSEIVVVAVVAILVWGRRLPQVVGQAAGVVQKVRRSLEELRRETGIDREIQNARRAVDQAVPASVRSMDVRREARRLVEEEPPAPPKPASPPPDAPKAPGDEDR